MNDDGLGNTTSKSKEIQPEIMHEHKRKRMNVEHDRLSSLPDDLIHKILSFIDIKRVGQTSVLSSRWRFVWTSMPYLNFSSGGRSSLLKFSNIVKQVLSGRNNEIDVYSVKLDFRGKVSQVFVSRILNYAFSHNVQEMTITSSEKQIEFPLSLFNCQSLKNLTLGGSGYRNSLTATSTLELPSLTTLHLDHVTLIDDSSHSYISKCVNLKNLTLEYCKMMGSGGFTIWHPQLLSFTLKFGKGVVKVIAPQLKYVSLYLFTYDDDDDDDVYAVDEVNSLPFFLNGVPLLEEVDICIRYPDDAPKIIKMLQQFHAVKYLTINLEIVECLSSRVRLISNQPSPFANLKTLKIYPAKEISKKVDVSAVVKSYLLDSSPSATLTMVSREEVRAAKNATLALECIPKIRVLLDELKTELDKGKTIMESHEKNLHNDVKGKAKVENQRAQPRMEMPLHSKGSMKQIHSCWKDLSHRISGDQEKVSRIFSELKYVEELLTLIPASKKVKMQAWFVSMCEEAHTLMKRILERVKIGCDMNQNHLSVSFQTLVTKALEPSS
ncbi:putative F-box/FBD/LRR-repeat protein At4g13965 [Rutidosis leptorrhynchoides]|uniref:putative F-box/FBD/LRR-repeat protein At4g13965 n=1 Tax=Rutidosis leptorrhynchoides TaxID=125765 RepID=UPI003A98F1CA